jgi:hypothetical protein
MIFAQESCLLVCARVRTSEIRPAKFIAKIGKQRQIANLSGGGGGTPEKQSAAAVVANRRQRYENEAAVNKLSRRPNISIKIQYHRKADAP